ncbi:MAG: cadherin-like domain-containing protein, partial [Vicinamibacterales bacterium]
GAKQQWWTNADGSITIRTTLSRGFNDNTYGVNQIGWPGSNHKFNHLVGSDMVQLALFDANGQRRMEFKLDYITDGQPTVSGYGSTGVTGKDGAMLYGNAGYVLGANSSLAVNFNDYGYVLTTDSPATDASYTPNPAYPDWIYDVWYEVTINPAAFGSAGFGYPRITSMHASPSKTGNETEPIAVADCQPGDEPPPPPPSNAPPVAVADAATTDEGQAVTIGVTGNDSDPDGDSLTVSAVTEGAHGSVSVASAAAVTYTPAPGFSGTDTFTYTVSDGHGGTATATVTVTVTPVNHPPVAVFDTASTEQNKYVKIAVLGNDSDPDGDPLALTAITQGAHGTVTIYQGTQVKYTPASNYTGIDTFTYTISDGHGGTATATVTVTIAPVHGDDDDCRKHKGHRDHDGKCPEDGGHGDEDHGGHDGGHYPGDRDGCRDWSKNGDWDWSRDDDHGDRDGRKGHDDRYDRDDRKGSHYPGDGDHCKDYSKNGKYDFGRDDGKKDDTRADKKADSRKDDKSAGGKKSAGKGRKK